LKFILILQGILIGLTISAPLGPVGVLCIQRTIAKGLLAGFLAGLGAILADTFFATIAGFSISFIADFIARIQLHLRILGSIFLLYIGVKVFFTNPAKQLRKQSKSKPNVWGDMVSVFFLTISNPITLFVLGGVFAGFKLVTKESTTLSTIFLVFGIFIGAATWWLTLSFLVSLFRSKINLRRLLWINRITGIIIIITGIAALISLYFI